MRVVNAMKAAPQVESPVAQPAVTTAMPDLSADEARIASVPEDSNFQKVIHSTSAASQRRAYRKFILEEANRRRSEMVDLLFVHVRRKLADRANFGGVTIAFKLPNLLSQKMVFSVEIATCICPAHVQLDKKFGANFAALNFLNRRTINVPIRRIHGESDKDATVRVLLEMFA